MIEEAERFLASVLRGEPLRRWLGDIDGATYEDAVLQAASDHDVDVLLRHLLKERGEWPRVPLRLRVALDTRARHASVRSMLRGRELVRVLSALQDAGLPVLVMKGAALGQTHYPAAYLRTRYDTDLLVRKTDFARTGRALVDLGYHRVNSVSRDAVRTQWTFERSLERGIPEYIDLHWAVSNRPLFASMLSFNELARDAIRVIPPGNRDVTIVTPCPVHALLLSCIHRIAHHNGWPKLVWLYDVKLLAGALSESEWERFHALAAHKQITALCDGALKKAATLVGGQTDSMRTDVRLYNGATRDEPSAAYLGGVGTRWRSLVLDLRAVRGPAAKMRLVAGHAFPDATYMRHAYGASGAVALGAAYIRRVALGVWHLTRPVTRQI